MWIAFALRDVRRDRTGPVGARAEPVVAIRQGLTRE